MNCEYGYCVACLKWFPRASLLELQMHIAAHHEEVKMEITRGHFITYLAKYRGL